MSSAAKWWRKTQNFCDRRAAKIGEGDPLVAILVVIAGGVFIALIAEVVAFIELLTTP